MKKTFIFLSFIFTAMIVNAHDLDGKWNLYKLKNGDIFYKFKDGAQFIDLNTTENTISGQSLCNGFFGNIKLLTGNGIKFEKIGTTLKACIEEKKMNLESALLADLESIDSYEIIKGILYLKKGDNILLVFNP